MAISFTRYINIISGVVAGQGIKEVDMITRIMTTNVLQPVNKIIEFLNANAVGTFFGFQSEEYLRAQFYFSFISKLIGTPDKISFGRYANATVKPQAWGDPLATDTLAQFQAITAGTLTISINSLTATLTAINLSAATSLANVATLLQTALRAYSAGGTDFTLATVTYQTTPQAQFTIQGGVADAASIVITPTGAQDIGAALGLESVNAVFTSGLAAVQTPVQAMQNSFNISTNFASFVFTTASALSPTDIQNVAAWNASNNNDFVFLVPVLSSNASAISANVISDAGTALTLAPVLTPAQYPEMFPGMVAAATDYSKPNQSQNYMFQQNSQLTPAVADDTSANNYDMLRVNYMGVTQVAGQQLSFYQRGVMCGGATAPSDMNVYFNEIWFKSAMGVALMSMLLNLPEVPTSPPGLALILANVQPVIGQALINGTIIVGSAVLTAAQQSAVTLLTGSPTAWQQVQTIGYWYYCTFTSSIGLGGNTEYQANYTVVYTKNNAIRAINGTHAIV